jgi:hypothetical protein
MTNAKSRISSELKYITEDPMFYGGPQQLSGIATPVTLPQEAR